MSFFVDVRRGFSSVFSMSFFLDISASFFVDVAFDVSRLFRPSIFFVGHGFVNSKFELTFLFDYVLGEVRLRLRAAPCPSHDSAAHATAPRSADTVAAPRGAQRCRR